MNQFIYLLNKYYKYVEIIDTTFVLALTANNILYVVNLKEF